MRLIQYLNEAIELNDIITSKSEYGVTFKTGKSVTFNFVRFTNSGASAVKGNRFQQQLEPSGMYMLHDFDPNREPIQGQEKGKVTFKKPLVLKFNLMDETMYDDNSWKSNLVKVFGKKKKALSTYLKKLGYDGIVTVDKYGTSEIIKL